VILRPALPSVGVVTLSQIERNSPINGNVVAWDFNDLACCSIADIRLIALNVTTPGEGQFTSGGDVPVLADRASRGYFAAVAKLDDETLARSLGLGEAGAAAIYTQSSTLFHILSRIQIRLVALLLYLP
jgi:hypothetical protein